MADVALHPSFPGEELERLRKQRLDAILQERANAGATAGRVLRKCLFGAGHPYGWPVRGEEGSVQEMARTELERFYLRHYAPENASLIMVGDIDYDEALNLAERSLGSWSGETFGEVDLEEVIRSDRRTVLIDRPGAAQSEIRLARLAPGRATEDYYILEVLTHILGGGFSGRLNQNLREEKGFTYGAYCSVRYGREQSILVGSTPVESSVTKPSIAEMLKEFEALSSWGRPVTNEELTHAQEGLVRGFAQRFETLAQIASEVAELEGYGLEEEVLSHYTAGIEGVSLADLERASTNYLATNSSVLLVVGDAGRIESDLESLEFGPFERRDSEGQLIA